MGTISYSLAISADGFLARKDGSVDWLNPYFGPFDSPYEHERYYQTISSVVMGRKTFEKALSFGGYPYKGKPGIVVTRNREYRIEEPGVETLTGDIFSQVSKLKDSTDGKIWLVGGGELAGQFIENNLIDELVLSVMPVTIGNGIKWISDHKSQISWSLQGHFTNDKGIIQLVYKK